MPNRLNGIQAHKLALATMKTFEDEWKAYTEEEARFISAFDDEQAMDELRQAILETVKPILIPIMNWLEKVLRCLT